MHKKTAIISIGIFSILGAAALATSHLLPTFPFKNQNPIKVLLSEKKETPQVDLVIGGDIMLSRGIGWWNKKEGYHRSFENYHPLEQFPCFGSGECLLYFNLESIFSTKDNDQPKGGFRFAANTGNIETLLELKKSNQLLLSLANNHTNNAGGAGVKLTREILGQHEIAFFGAGTNTENAQAIYHIQKNGIHLCFQAFSYDGTSGIYGKQPLARNPLKLELMTGILKEMETHDCEVKILGLHRGTEYHFQPNQWQRDLAYKLIDAGADILLGGHSHVPGNYEIYNGKPIFYSFGNLLFDQDWGMRARGSEFNYIYDHELQRKTVPTYIPLLAELKITKSGTGVAISQPTFKMARIKKGQFFPIDDATYNEVVEKILTH